MSTNTISNILRIGIFSFLVIVAIAGMCVFLTHPVLGAELFVGDAAAFIVYVYWTRTTLASKNTSRTPAPAENHPTATLPGTGGSKQHPAIPNPEKLKAWAGVWKPARQLAAEAHALQKALSDSSDAAAVLAQSNLVSKAAGALYNAVNNSDIWIEMCMPGVLHTDMGSVENRLHMILTSAAERALSTLGPEQERKSHSRRDAWLSMTDSMCSQLDQSFPGLAWFIMACYQQVKQELPADIADELRSAAPSNVPLPATA